MKTCLKCSVVKKKWDTICETSKNCKVRCKYKLACQAEWTGHTLPDTPSQDAQNGQN